MKDTSPLVIESISDDGDSLSIRIIKGVGLSLIMVLMVGTCFGYPGIQPALIEHGIYSDACYLSENHTTCVNSKLSVSATVSFGVIYSSCFFVGLALDYIGIKFACFLGPILWSFFTYLSGVRPQTGWLFFVGMTGGTLTSLPIFFGIGLLSNGISPERFPALMMGLLTGFWDLGTLVYLLLGWIIRASHWELWQVFLGYSLLVGLPSLAFFCIFWPPFKRDVSSVENMPSMMNQFKDLGVIFRAPIYWAFVANNVIWVSFAGLFFPLVTEHMLWHGATPKVAGDYLTIWALILPIVGFPASLIAGFGINYKNKYALISLIALQVFLIVVLAITSTLSLPLWVQVITFISIVIWRMNAATLFNSMIPSLFDGTNFGKAIGMNWTICGIISVATVPVMTKAVLANHDFFLRFYLSFYGLGIVTAIILGKCFMTDIDESGRWKGLAKHGINTE